MFCKKEGNWTEVPYVQLFFFPKRPLRMAKQMQARYPDHGNPFKKPPNSLEQKNPSNAPSAPPLPLTQLPHTLDAVPQDSPPPVNSWREQSSCSF
jgi:hypothetical protein